MTILAGDRFSKELVRKYVRREMLMSSPIYNDWIEEERQEAAQEATQKATQKATQDSIIYLLESKFDLVPSDVRKKISEIGDISILKGLLKKLLSVHNIEEFEDFIDTIIK